MLMLDKIRIENPLMLAPMAGFTDSPFRRIARRHGAGLVVTELISSEGLVRGCKKTLGFLRFNEEERPIGIQIFGKSPEVMGRAASIVEDYKPDFIDINFGCPARKVYKNGSGSALLSDIAKLEEIASTVVKSVRIPVTAKIRTGKNESNFTYRETVKALEYSGIKMIFVHGRTADQGYGGKSNWDIIQEISEFTSLPVIGNGDIETHEHALGMMKKSGCSGVMIGRGAVGNPWVFSGEKPVGKSLIDQIMEHLDLMIELYGERGIVLMRKHVVKYIRGFKNASMVRKDLLTSTDRSEIFKIINDLGYEN